MDHAMLTIGVHYDAKTGEPLLTADDKIVGTAKQVREFLATYEDRKPSRLVQVGSREFDDAVIEAVRRAERRRLL